MVGCGTAHSEPQPCHVKQGSMSHSPAQSHSNVLFHLCQLFLYNLQVTGHPSHHETAQLTCAAGQSASSLCLPAALSLCLEPPKRHHGGSISATGACWGAASSTVQLPIKTAVSGLTLLLMRCGMLQDNPFADSTLYELNTTYVPPDLSETVDAVVPAVQPAAAAPGAQQPAAAGAYRPASATPPAVAGPAVPAAGGTVPALPFTGALGGCKSTGTLGAVCQTRQCSIPHPVLCTCMTCCMRRVKPEQHTGLWQYRQARWVAMQPPGGRDRRHCGAQAGWHGCLSPLTSRHLACPCCEAKALGSSRRQALLQRGSRRSVAARTDIPATVL